MLSLPCLLYAQDLSNINITVVNEFEEPLAGLQLQVGKTEVIAVTNEKGVASFQSLQKGDIVNILSSTGAKHSASINSDQQKIVMNTNTSVVQKGFNLKETKFGTTASINSISSQSLNSSATNPANALYGALAGLTVMQNGTVAWDNNPSISIRGGLNSPLILVDGFERPLDVLTVEEIESISVLKDASALAIYGMRGANGVVLVTTKRGHFKGMKATASYQFGYNTPFRLPKMLNGFDYASAMNEALALDGLQARYSQHDLEDLRMGRNTELLPNVDWANEALRDQGYTHQLTASFSGGSKRVRYYSMLSYIGDNGFLKPVDLSPDYNSQMEWDRLSLRANLDITLTKTTEFKLGLLGQIAQHNRPTTNYSTLFSNLYSVPSAAFPVKTANDAWGGNNINANPVAQIAAGGYATSNDRTLLADMRIIQDLSGWINGLSAEVAIAYDNRTSYWDSKSKNYLFETISYDRDDSGNIINIDRTPYGQESSLSFSTSLGFQSRIATAQAKLNYNRIWNKDHAFNSSLIVHREENSSQGRNNTFRRMSFIGNANYSLKDKYIFDLAVSHSGSNVLNKGDKYRTYPALSGAWIISSEDFMANQSAIDFLKLRASWGITGSDLMAFDLGKHYFIQGGSTYYFGSNNNAISGNKEGALANLDLNPEIVYKTNVGIDLQLLKKLTFTADVFYEKRTNMLYSSASEYSSIIGVTTPTVNKGELSNRGFETSLTWQDKKGDFNYLIGANLSFARNKVENMNEEYQPEEYLKRTGHRLNQFFGLQALGFFKDETDIQNSPTHSYSQVRPGDVKYKDQNNDGIINDYDMVAQGYSTWLPEIYYGINLQVGYKGFELKADFQGVGNYSVVKNMGSMYIPLRNNTNVSQHYYDNRWTPENQNSMYPRLSTLENANNYKNSSVWLANGAFFKLRNVELSYSLPKSLISKFKAEKVLVFAKGMNLFSMDHIKDLDPELMSASYPSSRSYHLGVNIEF